MVDDLHHLAAAYALDALEPDERRAFEAHYPSCEICSAEVVDYRAMAARLGGAIATQPPEGLRSAVLEQVARTRQVSPVVADRVVDLAVRRWRRAGLILGAAAAAVLVAGIVLLRDPSSRSADDLVALISAADMSLQPLPATAVGDEVAAVRVAWSTERGELAVFGSGLDDPGDDSVYALWLLDNKGVPVPSLLFSPDGDGTVDAIGELLGTPAGWGVTIEPEAGSPQPTGDILYLTS